MSEAANSSEGVGAEIVRLRDEQGMGWKEISIKLELSPSGKPAPKKAKRIYDTEKGVPGASKATETKRTPRAPKTGRKRVRQDDGSVEMVMPEADPQYTDMAERDLAVRLVGRSVDHLYTMSIGNGRGKKVLRTDTVMKIRHFGSSPRSGRRYVDYIDMDNKHRVITLDSIVRIH